MSSRCKLGGTRPLRGPSCLRRKLVACLCLSAKPLSSCRGDEVNRGSRRATAHGTVSQVKGTQSSISGRIGKSALHKREGIWIKCRVRRERGPWPWGPHVPRSAGVGEGREEPTGRSVIPKPSPLGLGQPECTPGLPASPGADPGGRSCLVLFPSRLDGNAPPRDMTPSKATAFFFKKEKWGKRK